MPPVNVLQQLAAEFERLSRDGLSGIDQFWGPKARAVLGPAKAARDAVSRAAGELAQLRAEHREGRIDYEGFRRVRAVTIRQAERAVQERLEEARAELRALKEKAAGDAFPPHPPAGDPAGLVARQDAELRLASASDEGLADALTELHAQALTVGDRRMATLLRSGWGEWYLRRRLGAQADAFLGAFRKRALLALGEHGDRAEKGCATVLDRASGPLSRALDVAGALTRTEMEAATDEMAAEQDAATREALARGGTRG
jgi:hypothetical protein